MINKDANRLSVLRAIIADLTNRAKTNSAAKNPSSTLLLSVLSKHANSSRDAAAQFTAANRADLADKEISQANVLQEYIGGVETAGEEEMRTVVSELVKKKEGEGKVDMARIREAAMKVLEEERRKALDMKALMRVIKDAVG
ncbi:MAG: hypothetical protein M1837_006339 [Sclerophora amabilis]|nr:MAG: hypothetical protein M1837_006339 [Sclerophora amabilis]